MIDVINTACDVWWAYDKWVFHNMNIIYMEYMNNNPFIYSIYDM